MNAILTMVSKTTSFKMPEITPEDVMKALHGIHHCNPTDDIIEKAGLSYRSPLAFIPEVEKCVMDIIIAINKLSYDVIIEDIDDDLIEIIVHNYYIY